MSTPEVLIWMDRVKAAEARVREVEAALTFAKEGHRELAEHIVTLQARLREVEAARDEALADAQREHDCVEHWSLKYEQTYARLETVDVANADLEAMVARQAGVLQAIVDRHPDSPPGEHPAVDLARAVLASPEARVREVEAERDRLQGVFISTLAHHALVEIRCDHDAMQDMPICNCALWPGGWHPSVQAAKEAWARHVWAVLASPEADATEPPEISDRDAPRMLRDAWNAHMETCPQHAALPIPTFEEVQEWLNAPSGTMSACGFGCGPADESHNPPGGFIVVAGCPIHAAALPAVDAAPHLSEQDQGGDRSAVASVEYPHHLDLESTVSETLNILDATFSSMVGDEAEVREARRRIERLRERLIEITGGLSASRPAADTGETT